MNWVVLDSDWEAEFCRVAEKHPRVRTYVKNHGLFFEVPYRFGSVMRRYLPDFIVRVEDGHGEDDLLNLIVEIKGYRGEDAKEKKSTMETYWVPGVNNLGTYGRWAFAELTEVYRIESDFEAKVEAALNEADRSRAHRQCRKRAKGDGKDNRRPAKTVDDADPRRGDAQEHPDGGVRVARRSHLKRRRSRWRTSGVTPTSIRSSSGVARKKDRPIWWFRRRRCTSRKRSIQRR